ncbi:AAEL001275-PA [Aedes aegypti]|uniref:EF-hand domain-containing protein n=2 Tax=Aedes aegypti TaxID=7159 RepID=Q17LR4_AEDAE|nr:nucleobindin-2 [Aedes aegypti]XP_021698487.1 nucleobindin-2 [Aedes aegypti]EAT47638.1 AAEL001275-PA [Aedes aegypti]
MYESGKVSLVGVFFLIVVLLENTFSLPVVTQAPKTEKKEEEQVKDSNVEHIENAIEYNKYLQEVVKVLESDPVFRDKLDKAAESDIRSGKIAQELEYVNHNVRSQLDELKRIELQRLRELATRQFELSNNIDREHLKIAEHLDHENQHTFEIDDLKKLILKTSQDLSENDRRRREEFKEYELQKEFEKQEKLRLLDEEHRKQYEEDLKKQKETHEKHEKIHHPGNKAQLEEVWEKQDHMDGQDFDPKTFFMLHDIDGNGYWDENEVKVLFINELNKMYEAGHPEDDMKERAEEMERMREHVFQEADTNKDGLISYEEFIEQTKRDEFQKDPEWDTVDHQPQFTHEEYLEYERRNQEHIQRLIAEGKLPPHPNMPQGYYPGPNNGPYQVHPNAIPQNQQYHPQQGHPNQVPQYQAHPQQGYPQQVNLHPNQVYQHHQDPNYQPQTGQQSNVYQHPPQYQQQPPQQPPQYQQQQPQQPPAHPQQQYQQHPAQPQPQYQQQQQQHAQNPAAQQNPQPNRQPVANQAQPAVPQQNQPPPPPPAPQQQQQQKPISNNPAPAPPKPQQPAQQNAPNSQPPAGPIQQQQQPAPVQSQQN